MPLYIYAIGVHKSLSAVKYLSIYVRMYTSVKNR